MGPEVAGIVLDQISVKFRGIEKPVLDSVSLDLTPGGITAILGPSGCGKSTLLRVVAGLLTPNSGTLNFTVSGRKLSTIPPGRLAYVFQEAGLLPWRSVLANAALPMELLGLYSAEQRRSRAAEQLQAVGLAADQYRKTPAQLSGGMKMRVSIARALVTDPSILLLDEPFAALDDILRSRLGEMVIQLWRSRRRSIVLVTHNIAEAILLSQQIVVMGQGKIAAVIPIDLEVADGVDPRTTDSFSQLYGRVSKVLRAAADDHRPSEP